MGVLTVRGLDDSLIRALRVRAAQHGRSAEAEHRLILEEVLQPRRREFKAVAWRRRKSLEGLDFTDTTDLIRAFRDEGPT